ncbi:MAG TPA: DUF1844 domain-containing protein [Bacteroidales bacterium]|nr:DUF1844 domain-containing protein [Bacteroidales bacterium]HPS15849.1 DUF1844 domain-containing protein [Bacteroidales bacterium]
MEKKDQMFLELLYIFHASAMQAMGKIKNPITGNTEKNMDQARHAIEMLEMLKEKTNGNLSEELLRALETFLSEMRLNFVEETNKNKN